MNNKKFIGTFHSEEATIRKIQELKSQGYDGNDIYAVARDEHDISMVRGRTDVDVQSTEGSWIDRFMAFLSGEEPVRGALRNMGLTEAECDRYYNEIDNGAILLYVDKDYGSLYFSGSNIVREADGNLGPDPLNRTGYVHTPNLDLYDDSEERKLRLHEEKLNIDKETVGRTGEVNGMNADGKFETGGKYGYYNEMDSATRRQNYVPPSESFEDETADTTLRSHSYDNKPLGSPDDELLSTEDDVRRKTADELQTDDDNPYTNEDGRRLL